jgi:protein O-GlcNAc transferase
MVKVFSFCIFGRNPKYCMGLLKNIELIKQHFPEWMIWVYIGDTIPVELDQRLAQEQYVHRIYTEAIGMENKVFRFFPIDMPDVEVCIVRDTDSRIHARDRACIQDFLDSDMKFHIIRDHPNHFHKIMAGMFGMKQGCVLYKIQEAYVWWKQEYATDAFWDDTYFLVDVIYPDIKFNSLIHDDYTSHEPPHFKQPFRVQVSSNEFVGQAYDFDADGNEYPLYI